MSKVVGSVGAALAVQRTQWTTPCLRPTGRTCDSGVIIGVVLVALNNVIVAVMLQATKVALTQMRGYLATVSAQSVAEVSDAVSGPRACRDGGNGLSPSRSPSGGV
jgi:hypothetical protein